MRLYFKRNKLMKALFFLKKYFCGLGGVDIANQIKDVK